jgi:hypothetical protein
MKKTEDNPDMRILKTATTKTITGKSTLTYQIGCLPDTPPPLPETPPHCMHPNSSEAFVRVSFLGEARGFSNKEFHMKIVVWIAVFIAVYSALKLNDCEKSQTSVTQESVPEYTENR